VTSSEESTDSVGLGFSEFRAAALRVERWKRVSRFLSALSTRHHIEYVTDGYVVGNERFSEGEIEGISRGKWDGTPEHADELVGDYLESVLA